MRIVNELLVSHYRYYYYITIIMELYTNAVAIFIKGSIEILSR